MHRLPSKSPVAWTEGVTAELCVATCVAPRMHVHASRDARSGDLVLCLLYLFYVPCVYLFYYISSVRAALAGGGGAARLFFFCV